jgi:hypothetical protein
MANISELTLILEENIVRTITSVIEVDEPITNQTPLSVISEQSLTPCKDIKSDEICSICLSLLKNDSENDFCMRLLKCHHIYHETCIVKWLSQNTSCPICRVELINKD